MNFFDRVVASAFLQTNRLYTSQSIVRLVYSWFEKRYTDAVKNTTIQCATCHHCPVIHVFTNGGMFGVDKKYILSSLDQQLSFNVIVNCVFNTDKWNE